MCRDTHLFPEMAEPTLYSILESRRITKSALERKCTERHLANIAQSIASWKEVSPFLGLNQQDEADIQSDNSKNSECKVAMLRRWSELHGEQATYYNLAEAFECVKWRDCIDVLLDLFKELQTEDSGGKGVASREQQPPASPLGIVVKMQLVVQ